LLNLNKLEDTKKKTQVVSSRFVKEAQKGKSHLDEAKKEVQDTSDNIGFTHMQQESIIIELD
jgi:hypothetical protein